MAHAPKKVYTIIEPIVTGLQYELVGIEWLAQGKHSLLRVYIDHAEAIKIEDCQAVSRQVSAALDVDDVVSGQYQLEVSSPGLDRPLFTLEHFKQFVGAHVSIKCTAPINRSRKFTGDIMGVENSVINLKVNDDVIAIDFSHVQKANLVPDIE